MKAKRAAPELEAEVDRALGLVLISIRLPKTLIDDFKAIGAIEGVGYQPVMRDALTTFSHCYANQVMHLCAANKTEKSERAKP